MLPATYRLGDTVGIFLPATGPGFHHSDTHAHDEILNKKPRCWLITSKQRKQLSIAVSAPDG